MLDIVDILVQALPLMWVASFVLAPWYARTTLHLVRERMQRDLERHGQLVEETRIERLDASSWPALCIFQLRTDLASLGPLMVILFSGSLLFLGWARGEPFDLVFGIVVAAVYLRMFFTGTRAIARVAGKPRFTAKLVELRRPSFLRGAGAIAELPTGRSFETHVDWPMVELVRERGDVELILIGSPDEPRLASVIGARSALPSEQDAHAPPGALAQGSSVVVCEE